MFFVSFFIILLSQCPSPLFFMDMSGAMSFSCLLLLFNFAWWGYGWEWEYAIYRVSCWSFAWRHMVWIIWSIQWFTQNLDHCFYYHLWGGSLLTDCATLLTAWFIHLWAFHFISCQSLYLIWALPDRPSIIFLIILLLNWPNNGFFFIWQCSEWIISYLEFLLLSIFVCH